MSNNALIIIPTYNELDNLAPIVAAVFENLPQANILIVDDNSPDGTGAKADEIVAKYPYLVKAAIPAGTYKGQAADAPTLSVQAMLVVNKDMPEELAYKLTQILFENLPDVAKAHKKGAEISLDRATDGVTIPFHPGAEKFLKEKGALK